MIVRFVSGDNIIANEDENKGATVSQNEVIGNEYKGWSFTFGPS